MNRPIHDIEQHFVTEDHSDLTTLEEIEKPIKQIQWGKSPGPDEIPIEIFKDIVVAINSRLMN